MKIGLLAGDGDLPKAVVAAARNDAHDVVIVQLSEGMELGPDGQFFSLGEFGKITKYFKKSNVTHVCFAGNVARPDFKKLRPDFKTLTKLPGAIKAAKDGDDALLKYVVKTFEHEGFSIIAPQELCRSLLMPVGALGSQKLVQKHRGDAEKALKTALEIGKLDIGQGAVVCAGLVLAVEAQEGTDKMLQRVAQLPADIRGEAENRKGVIAKILKPGQESRVDLPTIGPETIRLAAAAGLAGIILEADKAFVLDKEKVVEAADQFGLFVVGLPPSTT